MQGNFRVGDVLGRSFDVLSQKFWTFYVLAIAFACPSTIIDLWFVPSGPTDSSSVIFGSGLARLVEYLLMYILTAVLVFGTIRQLRGGAARMDEMLLGGLACFPLVLGVTILMTLFIGLPLVLINLPAIASPYLLMLTIPVSLAVFAYLTVLMWVAVPAAVVERAGVVASLVRSAKLTAGYRPAILGIILLLYGLLLMAGLVAGVLLELIGNPTLTAIGELLLLGAFYTCAAVISAVSYHDLRIAKEGDSVSGIAAVFD